MADIAINYSKRFEAQTEQLADELRAKGFTAWRCVCSGQGTPRFGSAETATAILMYNGQRTERC